MNGKCENSSVVINATTKEYYDGPDLVVVEMIMLAF